MSNNKKSSIEIFYEEVWTSFGSKFSWLEREKLINLKEQAKASHMEEIVQTFERGYSSGYRDNGDSGIDYYHETFGEK